MIVIAAVDDNNGMMFNRRRQSQDRNLRNYILEMVKGSRLFMNEYTYRQFAEMGEAGSICVAENFLECATDDDYCFVENAKPLCVRDIWHHIMVMMDICAVSIKRWGRITVN